MEITPTPIIYIEDIRLSDLSINGAVFSIASDGTYIPEVGAYVYVYVGGILSNEQSGLHSMTGTTSRSGLVTTTDANGKWVCPVSSLRAGQRLTAVAHSAGKAISEPSIPYRVGSLPIPTDIHTVNQYGQEDSIKHNQYTIEGFFEGLHDRKYVEPIPNPAPSGFEVTADGYTIPAGYLFPYRSNFNLCPYIDGVKQNCLHYNEIWSKNFLDTVLDISWDACFTIVVQDVPVEVCLNNVTTRIYNEIFTFPDLKPGNALEIHPPLDPGHETITQVYKNGLRMIEGQNADYVIQVVGPFTSLIFTAGFGPNVDDVYQCDYLVVHSEDKVYYTTNVVRNSTGANFSVNRGLGLQVFRNGVRLKEGDDFSISTDNYDRFVNLSDNLTTTDVLVMAYFNPSGNSVDYRIETTTDFIPFIVPYTDNAGNQALYSIIRVYKTSMVHLPQMISLYKDGLHLAFGTRFDFIPYSSTTQYIDYRLAKENPFDFEVVPNIDGSTGYLITNNLVVELMYAGISISKTEVALSSLPEFVANKIHASVIVSDTNKFLMLSSPYTLEFLENDTSYYSTFGQYPSIVPGKDDNGNFKFFIDFKNNRWRYTFAKPLKRMHAVTAATFIRT